MSVDIGPFSSMRSAIGPVLPGDCGLGPAMRKTGGWRRLPGWMVQECLLNGAGVCDGWCRYALWMVPV